MSLLLLLFSLYIAKSILFRKNIHRILDTVQEYNIFCARELTENIFFFSICCMCCKRFFMMCLLLVVVMVMHSHINVKYNVYVSVSQFNATVCEHFEYIRKLFFCACQKYMKNYRFLLENTAIRIKSMIKQRESLIFHIVHSFLTGFKGIFFIISVSYHIFTSVFYFYRIIIRYWFINQQLLHTLKLIYRNPANRRRRKKRKKLQIFMFLSF